MVMWRKQNREEKVEREESGKLISLKLSKKSGEPILGFTSPSGEDQTKRLRAQAAELREMAEKLERMAEEMERKAQGGKAARFLGRIFRRGAPQEGK
jgi:hypothetical protein